MSENKKTPPTTKSKLHSRSLHRMRYDLALLCKSYPPLSEFVYVNKYEDTTIDFFDQKAVRALNQALLKHYYKVGNYNLPPKYLFPPIPGRADYIHYIADFLVASEALDLSDKSGYQKKIKCLDIGTGANCIYPILGSSIYDWSFVGSDIDAEAIKIARSIIESNNISKKSIELRHQANPKSVFNGIIKHGEKFTISICNPPFHASAEEAHKAGLRKVRNLKQKKTKKLSLNFSGTTNELWCEGGEKKFITDMIKESKDFGDSCTYFTCLVSKETTLPAIYKAFKQVKAKSYKNIEMGQGNKTSRIVAWRF